MKTHEVTVAVPVYKTDLNPYERISLERLFAVLGRHRIVIVKPRSLSVAGLLRPWPEASVEDFDDGYFRGIAGYNRLMMSEEFYERFADSEYVLIYQLDAYVFADRLEEWCRKGYDYVGAPWPVKPIYNFPPYRICSWVKRKWCEATGRRNRQITRGKVGNGGLSLRRVDAHLRAVRQLRATVELFLSQRHHTYNEDVFFGVEVNLHGLGFRYPEWHEALGFSFDKYPSLCYKWTGGKLPFGCHSWYKRKMRRFWFPIILNQEK